MHFLLGAVHKFFSPDRVSIRRLHGASDLKSHIPCVFSSCSKNPVNPRAINPVDTEEKMGGVKKHGHHPRVDVRRQDRSARGRGWKIFNSCLGKWVVKVNLWDGKYFYIIHHLSLPASDKGFSRMTDRRWSSAAVSSQRAVKWFIRSCWLICGI